MRRETITRKGFSAILATVAIALFVLVSVTVGAQGSPGQISASPFDAILAKLDQVLAVLNPPPSTALVLSTPFLKQSTTQLTECAIANVGATAFTYEIRAITDAGVTAFGQASGTLQAGRGSVVGSGATSEHLRCEYRVTGAPASSVRANISLRSADGAVASADAR